MTEITNQNRIEGIRSIVSQNEPSFRGEGAFFYAAVYKPDNFAVLTSKSDIKELNNRITTLKWLQSWKYKDQNPGVRTPAYIGNLNERMAVLEAPPGISLDSKNWDKEGRDLQLFLSIPTDVKLQALKNYCHWINDLNRVGEIYHDNKSDSVYLDYDPKRTENPLILWVVDPGSLEQSESILNGKPPMTSEEAQKYEINDRNQLFHDGANLSRLINNLFAPKFEYFYLSSGDFIGPEQKAALIPGEVVLISKNVYDNKINRMVDLYNQLNKINIINPYTLTNEEKMRHTIITGLKLKAEERAAQAMARASKVVSQDVGESKPVKITDPITPEVGSGTKPENIHDLIKRFDYRDEPLNLSDFINLIKKISLLSREQEINPQEYYSLLYGAFELARDIDSQQDIRDLSEYFQTIALKIKKPNHPMG
jgi:hypothetical protein